MRDILVACEESQYLDAGNGGAMGRVLIKKLTFNI